MLIVNHANFHRKQRSLSLTLKISKSKFSQVNHHHVVALGVTEQNQWPFVAVQTHHGHRLETNKKGIKTRNYHDKGNYL